MAKDTLFYKKKTIRFRGKLLEINQPLVMGILNVTPDSFYDGGKYPSTEEILKQTRKMLIEGASIIDIGAYSSRPGSEEISAETELSRLEPALTAIRTLFPDIIISVDTFRAKVARQAIEGYKIDIINDISGGTIDPEITDIAAAYGIPYIAMHMKGTPVTMQKETKYQHVITDLLSYFAEKIDFLVSKGIHDIIVDPGFGFAKTLEQNYQLMAGLESFQILGYPIMVGISRKSMIYKLLETNPSEALTGTIALNMVALQNGASILRVHDVKEAVETIKIYKKLIDESQKSLNLL